MRKKKKQMLHAKIRVKQRFGINYNKEQLNQLIKDIQSRKFKSIPNTSTNTKTLFRVTFMEEEMIAVYDKIRKTIITFMSLNDYYE